MNNLNIIVDDDLRERATNQCNFFIDCLKDYTLSEKAFILHQLVQSFKDVSGIDICKFIEITEGKGE